METGLRLIFGLLSFVTKCEVFAVVFGLDDDRDSKGRRLDPYVQGILDRSNRERGKKVMW